MIARLLLLAAVLGLAWLVVELMERRGTGSSVGVPSGLTIVTGDDCRLCPQAIAAAGEAGVSVNVVDVSEVSEHGIRSLPTALVTDGAGTVLVRRSGRSVISDMGMLADLVRSST